MRSRRWQLLVGIGVFVPLLCFGQSAQKSVPNGGDFSNAANPASKVPTGVILVKGAWSSASDSVTPLPEGGKVSNNVYDNEYFRIRYSLPSGWTQRHEGPPPSDSGGYVLAQLSPVDRKGQVRGSIVITAHDLFFTPLPAHNVPQQMNYAKDHLQADYKVEEPPTETKVAGRPFMFLGYWSPAAQLHWYVFATQIRCHSVEIILSSRDTKLLENLVLQLDKMTLPTEAGLTTGMGGEEVPVCVKGYASGENVLSRVDPVLTESKFNAIPVRIIVNKKGRVKHVHFLSAFPDQAKAITDALAQWKFKPYLRDGQAVDVETGIMFGRVTHAGSAQAAVE